MSIWFIGYVVVALCFFATGIWWASHKEDEYDQFDMAAKSLFAAVAWPFLIPLVMVLLPVVLLPGFIRSRRAR